MDVVVAWALLQVMYVEEVGDYKHPERPLSTVKYEYTLATVRDKDTCVALLGDLSVNLTPYRKYLVQSKNITLACEPIMGAVL